MDFQVLGVCMLQLLLFCARPVRGLNNSDTLLRIASQLKFTNPTWVSATDPCTSNWLGVTCADGYIDTLSLTLQQLQGDISNIEFSDLANLTYLDISNNNLQGTIPSSLFSLARLKTLFIGRNNFSGGLSEDIGKLASLVICYVDTNQLTGAIPSSLSNLKHLQQLYLYLNYFEGQVPAEIGSLGNLTLLKLHTNRLTGVFPSSISKLSNLVELDIAYNSLSGDLSFLQSMESLEQIYLQGNNFTGRLPQFTFNTSKNLSLGFNKFEGEIPSSYAGPNLEVLFLRHAGIDGVFPQAFARLSTLKYLDISHNAINGSTSTLSEVSKSSSNIQLNYAFNYFDIQGSDTFSDLMCEGQPRDPCISVIRGNKTDLAINAGSAQAALYDGISFEADFSTDSTTGLLWNSNSNWRLEISGQDGGVQKYDGFAAALYRDCRWSSDFLAYHATGLQQGSYNVTLHFLEHTQNWGRRIFDVYVQRILVQREMNILEQVGYNTPYVIWTTAMVETGLLSIELWARGYNGAIICGISINSLSLVPLVPTSSHYTALGGIIGGTIGGILLLLVLLGFSLYKLKLRGHQNLALPMARTYRFKELQKATNSFHADNKLGTGGFGEVYKGVLQDGTVVAVKRLLEKAKTATENFHREIRILCMLQHKNLVGVNGYCITSEEQLIVCDYMPNGSLDKLLFAQEEVCILSWELRRNIAVGAACGLAYLHEDSKVSIIHCDVKPANILLDADYNARICDFGLSRLYEGNITHITATKIIGTPGYISPEYATHLHLSDKVDVYSMGVVLLELITGKKAFDPKRQVDKILLVDWASNVYKDQSEHLDTIIDKRLGKDYNNDEAKDIIKIAMLCTHDSPDMRPTMREVWMMLKGSIPIIEEATKIIH